MDLMELSLTDVSQLVRTGKTSPVELTNQCLRRIDRLDPKLNAFITITADSALSEARQAESEIQHGRWTGPLHGIPIALKDLVDTAGIPTTAASGVFKDRIPASDADVVRRLKSGGAVFLGKLNMHEFAYGGSSVVSYFGPVRNPWNIDYSTGGSSGGSAAAVAAQLCYASIGSDTGGSIRQPAAYCGVVGLKPSYGRNSTSGIIPLSRSLDHIGPLTRTVRDAALLLQMISGDDAAPIQIDSADYLRNIEGPTLSLRLGIPRNYFYDRLDPEIAVAMKTALEVLATLTADQHEIPPLASDDTYASLMKPYGTVFRAEAYEYHKDHVARNPELYQPQTLERIRSGANITTQQYEQSRRAIVEARELAKGIFETVDLLITPTTCVPAFRIDDLLGDPETLRDKELLMLRNTRPFNMLGLPTVSVPCGFTGDGLPIGMQISGPPGGDEIVLRLAHAYEQATDWVRQRPEL